MKCSYLTAIALVALAVMTSHSARADVIVGGSAQFVLNNNAYPFAGGFGPLTMERHYGTNVETATGAQLLAGVGGDVINVPGSGLVTLNANVNGLSVTSPAGGRARQATNLDVDFSNVLATWGATEKIGIDSVLRTVVSPLAGGGVIGLGDYSLENNGGVLTLFNNLSFRSEAFTLGSTNIQALGNGFSVTGRLLTGSGLSTLTGATLGSDLGSFSLTVTAVPEPSSALLLGVSVIAFSFRRRR